MSKDKNAEAVEMLKKVIALLGAASEADDVVDFPPLQKINKMDEDSLKKLAEKVGIENFDDREKTELRELLGTIASISAGETDDLDKDDVKTLTEALGLEVSKKKDENLALIQEYLGLNEKDAAAEEESEEKDEESEEEESEDEEKEEESEEEEEESEEEESEEEEEEEEEKPAKKGKKAKDEDEDEDEEEEEEKSEEEEEESEEEEEKDEEESEEEESEEAEEEEEEVEEVDAAAVAAKAKLPKDAIMQKHLDAYNKIAGKEKIKGKDLKASYRSLLERCVGDNGELAEWGTAYVKDGSGWCCGLEMEDAKKPKGEKRDLGKCKVTGKVFAYEADDEQFVALDDE